MTVTEERVDIFLEHFGKKGMKWGVRNIGSTSGADAGAPKDHTRRNRNLKRAVTGVVIAGATVATIVLLHKSGHKVSAIPGIAKRAGTKVTDSILDKFGSKVADKIISPKQQGPSPKAQMSSQAQALIKQMTSRRNQSMKEVNEQARQHYEEYQTPIPNRTYEKMWA